MPVIVKLPHELKHMAKKLFGKDSLTILDCVKKVVEQEEGREAVEELVNQYGKIFFSGISESYGLKGYSMNVYAFPLTKPHQSCLYFNMTKAQITFPSGLQAVCFKFARYSF